MSEVLQAALSAFPADAPLMLRSLQRTAPGEHHLVLASGDGELALALTGVGEYRLIQPEETFLPEDVKVSFDDPLLWDHGKLYAVYGNAPLPDPPRFFLDFHRMVRSELQSRRDPLEYLNWRQSFSEWLNIVYSRSYNLLTAPAPIAEGACRLLEAQALEYMILPDPREAPAVSPLLFEFGRSWIIAQQAALINLED